MPAQALFIIVSPHHHRHGIPANQRADAALHKQVTGHYSLIFGLDGVFEGRGNRGG